MLSTWSLKPRMYQVRYPKINSCLWKYWPQTQKQSWQLAAKGLSSMVLLPAHPQVQLMSQLHHLLGCEGGNLFVLIIEVLLKWRVFNLQQGKWLSLGGQEVILWICGKVCSFVSKSLLRQEDNYLKWFLIFSHMEDTLKLNRVTLKWIILFSRQSRGVLNKFSRTEAIDTFVCKFSQRRVSILSLFLSLHSLA